MARKPTRTTQQSSTTPSSINERIGNGARAAVEAVRQLISPKFGEIDGRLDDHGARLDAIEKDPISPDELASQIVREVTPQWSLKSTT